MLIEPFALSTDPLSVLKSITFYQVAMGNFSQLPRTPEFEADVDHLPATFDPQDDEQVDLFETFFSRWGHFVITRVYGGGCVAVNISSSSSSADDFEKVKVISTVKSNCSVGIGPWERAKNSQKGIFCQ